MDYLDAQVLAAPEQAAHWSQLADYWQKKLWHQMSVKLMELTKNEYFQQDQNLLTLHQRFVQRFADQLKQLMFVKLSIAAANQHTDAKAAIAFMEKITKIETVDSNPQAKLLGKLEMARMHIAIGNVSTAKTLLEAGKKDQDAYGGIMESDIYSKFYLSYLCYYKATGEASKYFENTMLYLTYTRLDQIDEKERAALAADVGKAALLGDTIYNFGELLLHPILKVLSDSDAWLGRMLNAFNAGDIKSFNSIYAQASSSNPSLVSQQAFLNQKVRIMALMELVLSRGSSERNISFADIAAAIDCKEDQVEMLVMKAFSLKVVRGKIDQVNNKIRFTWVQPRVLDNRQISRLRDRLQTWGAQVSVIAENVEKQAPELLSLAR